MSRHSYEIRHSDIPYRAASDARFSQTAHAQKQDLALFAKARLRGHQYELRVKYMLRANPPTHCACCQKVLDYSVGRGYDTRDSPSLDRWDNTKGYILGNVRVVCFRCNELKRDGTLKEFKNLVRYMK